MSGLVSKEYGLAEAVTLDGKTLSGEVMLNVDGGTGVILRVEGSYRKSSFGLPLERLVQCWEPIRIRGVSSSIPQALPKEVWLLGDAILSSAQPFPTNLDERIDDVRDRIDNGKRVKDYVSAASCLLALLRELPEPILTKDKLVWFIQEEKVIGPAAAAQNVVNSLPDASRNVVVYLSALLRSLPGASHNTSAVTALSSALLHDQTANAAMLLHATPLSIRFPSPNKSHTHRIS